MTRAGFRPRRACGSGSASTISPSTAPPSSPGGTSHSALERRSVGTMRPALAIDAEDAAGRVGDTPHGAALVAAGPDRLQARQHAFAGRQCRAAGWFGGHEDHRRRAVRAVPVGGPGDGVAIRVGAGDDDDGGLGQAHVCRPGAGPIDPAIHGVRQGWVTPCICGFGGRAASIFRRADAT